MIGYLSGQIIKHEAQEIIVMTGCGVGYQVRVGINFFGRLIDQAENKLEIYTHVREDQLELFGFESLSQKKLFLQLIGVSGVGPKTALQITDQGVEKVTQAVQMANPSFFSSIPRVGKKLAQKIIIELKSKLGSLQELNLGPKNPLEQDLFEALLALGFDEAKIGQTVGQLDTSGQVELSLLVKQAIKLLN